MKDVNIKALTRIKENYERLWAENLAKEEDIKEEYDAVCAGITALEAEPCEDCISRSEFLKRIAPYDTADKMDHALYRFAYMKMKDCKTVYPARIKGEWEVAQADADVYNCNQCGIVVFGKSETSRFCPNCGAEMEDSK